MNPTRCRHCQRGVGVHLPAMFDPPAVTVRVERSTHGKTRMPASIRESGYLVTGPSFTALRAMKLVKPVKFMKKSASP